MSTRTITRIEPLGAPLAGDVAVPGDKSISHRAVLFAAMAEGVSKLEGVLDSADVRSSLGAVEALGARVDISVQPDGSLAGVVEGWGERGPQAPLVVTTDDAGEKHVSAQVRIDCGNSGTTTRLLMGILAGWDVAVELTGDSSLCRRPMRRVALPLVPMGARFSADTLPLTMVGSAALEPIAYESPVASAQVKTAVLLAGLRANGTTSVAEPAPSRNHTELMLPGYGVSVEAAPGYAAVSGPCSMHACDVRVPGDPSSAAFLACAAALREGSDLRIRNVSLNETRIGFARVLERMGADVELVFGEGIGNEPAGDVLVRHRAGLRACEVASVEIASMVDEIPVLALVAAHAQGETVFREAGELRVKESDRLQAIIDGLTQLGVRAWADGDDLHIEGKPNLEIPDGLTFDSLGDHRLAMTWSLVALTGATPVSIIDFDCVAVSYPQFLNDMQRLVR